LSILDKCAAGPVTGINFLGGEPFIRKDLPEIIRHGKTLGLEMSSNTNGMLLKPSMVDRVVEAGLDMLVVSIDGPDAETHDAVRGKNTFERLKGNMDYIKEVVDSGETNLQVTINTILSENNRNRVEDMFRLIMELKPFKWNLIGFQNDGVVAEQRKRLQIDWPDKIQMYLRIGKLYEEYLKDSDIFLGNKFMFPLVWEYLIRVHGLALPFPRITCGAGTSLGFIDPNGNLFPCDRLTNEHPAVNKFGFDLSNNSLLHRSFNEVWHRKLYDDIFKIIHDPTTYEGFKPCSACSYRKLSLCSPCPLYKFSQTGVDWDDCIQILPETCKNKTRLDTLDTLEFFKSHADMEMPIIC
jgi:radical SAM protein with 4Fe4S-binding SPASM domain